MICKTKIPANRSPFSSRLAFFSFIVVLVGAWLRFSSVYAQSTASDDMWNKLIAAEQLLSQTQIPSPESNDYERSVAKYCENAAVFADRCKEYLQKFPESVHQEDTWEKWTDWLSVAGQRFPDRKRELEKIEQPYLENPKTNPRRSDRIFRSRIERAADIREAEKLVRTFSNQSTEPLAFFCSEMLNVADFSSFPHSRELVDEVIARTQGHTNGVEKIYYDQALVLKRKLDRIGKRLELKFNALDGSEIDLARLRGKVVLLQFWATWCPPCVAEIPKVRKAFESFHAQGFEVIGISYDSDRTKLETFLKRNNVHWPQYFSTQGNGAPLIEALGKPGPPAYWLIDREGSLVDVVANQNLEQKIEASLKSPDQGRSGK